MLRPTCKLAAQGKGNIRHVIVCQSQQSEYHIRSIPVEAFFPAQKYCLHGSTRVNQVAHDLFSQFLSQGGVIQHQLMGPENL